VRSASRIACAVVVCHAISAVAWAESLADALAGVAANARFDAPARADVRIECTAPCTVSGTPAVLLGRGDAVYVELKGGMRALVRPNRIDVARDGKVAAAAAGEALADTDVLLEDLSVFTPAALKLPQISDDGPAGLVVTAAPSPPSVYALLVHTIDRDRHAIVRTLYYRDAINNLEKTRRDSALVRVGKSWRPGEIAVESVRRGSHTHLALAWKDAPDAPPALFEPAGLEKPSGLF